MQTLIFTKDISTEILVIYGLLATLIVFIIAVLILDKKDKKKQILAKTQELKIMDLRRANDDYIEEFKKVEDIMPEVEIEPIIIEEEEMLSEIDIDTTMYVEDDLERTSAQLKLEALTKELEKVQESEYDKISRFEEEQEENAIISYKELLKVSEQLYDSNEKVQYMDEGNEPITIEQLRNRFNNNVDNVEVI